MAFLVSPNSLDACIQACSPGACCYTSQSYISMEQLFDKFYGENPNPIKDAISCSSNIGFCQQYGSCEHLNHIQDTSTDEIDFELQIANLCTNEYIAKNGALSCSNVCQPAHCCFTPGSPCDHELTESSICDKYSQCKVLYPEQKDKEGLLLLAEDINQVCSDASSHSRYVTGYYRFHPYASFSACSVLTLMSEDLYARINVKVIYVALMSVVVSS